MTAIIAFLASTLGKYISLAVISFTALFTAWTAAKRAGAQEEKNRQTERDAKAVKTAKQVQDDVPAMSPEQRRKELGNWTKQ